MGPSDAHFGPPQPRTVEGQRPPRLRGPPVLRRVLSLRAVPTTPASHPEPGGCPGPGYSGLPRVRVGSALATALSGPAQGSLAFGPQICWPSFRGLLSGRLDVLQLPEDRPPVATRLNRQLPRQDSHLQERATFARRTLNGVAFEVVGVAASGFKGMLLAREPQIWIPMQSGFLLGGGAISSDDIWWRETRQPLDGDVDRTTAPR